MRQPGGLFARFSEVVDDFTHLNMTEAEVLDYCRTSHGMHEAAARYKLGGALADMPFVDADGHSIRPWQHRAKWDGLDRWRDAMETVRAIHGEDVAREREAEVGEGDGAATQEVG